MSLNQKMRTKKKIYNCYKSAINSLNQLPEYKDKKRVAKLNNKDFNEVASSPSDEIQRVNIEDGGGLAGEEGESLVSEEGQKSDITENKEEADIQPCKQAGESSKKKSVSIKKIEQGKKADSIDQADSDLLNVHAIIAIFSEAKTHYKRKSLFSKRLL